MALLEYETELRIRGCKVAALFEGKFDIDDDGKIVEITVTNYDGEKGALLPLEGELFEAMKAVLADEYIDDITDAVEDLRSKENAAAQKADRDDGNREAA